MCKVFVNYATARFSNDKLMKEETASIVKFGFPSAQCEQNDAISLWQLPVIPISCFDYD